MLVVTLLLSFYLTSPVFGLMKVTTYNLWNIMFNWDVRKYRIARMVGGLLDRHCDIVDHMGVSRFGLFSSSSPSVFGLKFFRPFVVSAKGT
jgi:hypothetical protein